VKFGVALGALNHRFHVDAVIEAERLGFESVWLPEHLVLTRTMSSSSPRARSENDDQDRSRSGSDAKSRIDPRWRNATSTTPGCME
jgi:alkanesulfonate monooxygenase SsuD/methylene tetrahydromethanopterin reductase-like flavin-dependent oxidoreductase (luciferase family)